MSEVVQEPYFICYEAFELVLVKCNESLLEPRLVLSHFDLALKAFRCSSVVAESNSVVQSYLTCKILDQETLTLDQWLEFTWIIVIDNKVRVKGSA